MSMNQDLPRDDARGDFARVAQGIRSRLISRGIEIHEADAPDDIVQMMDAVDAFERAVIARGGDLMVDEPPASHAGEPDDPHFLLPLRAADESAAGYASRLTAAVKVVQRHPRLL
jgi:hypothetical protein